MRIYLRSRFSNCDEYYVKTPGTPAGYEDNHNDEKHFHDLLPARVDLVGLVLQHDGPLCRGSSSRRLLRLCKGSQWFTSIHNSSKFL